MENELDRLFADYRAAVPDPEPSGNFMPELWHRIESRRTTVFHVKRLTQVFVAAAAAICLVFASYLTIPSSVPMLAGNYVDVLAEAQPAENLTALGIQSDPSE
jgi:hypothetical protein